MAMVSRDGPFVSLIVPHNDELYYHVCVYTDFVH